MALYGNKNKKLNNFEKGPLNDTCLTVSHLLVVETIFIISSYLQL